ncbi:MAG: threonine synthase [Proteobacteria bacterium]|nr:threonine synthase [Pseudomonadota bacterium]
MSYVTGLACRECKRVYPKDAIYVCEDCFGPLEVIYDYERIRHDFSPKEISSGPKSMWRYWPLLPLDDKPKVGYHVGYTPLVHARRLGEYLGLNRLYLKNDTVNCPSLSFKDRVVSVAVSKASEFGFDTVACASTGNLANSLAAQAAAAGLKSFILIPADIESIKVTGTLVYGSQVLAVEGTYDDVNRLCTEISFSYPWAFVNINLRPFYAEGSKTFAFEIVEQLGWQTPDHIVVPVAGCSLLTKIWKGFKELKELGWVTKNGARIHAAQATGCSPVTTAIKSGADGIRPVKPDTVAKSLAIGNPADGYYGLQATRETGGYGDDVSDDEIIEGMLLLSRTEGIFAETAGGVVVGVTKKLVEQGRIGRDDLTVLAITGNGLKTQELMVGKTSQPLTIASTMDSFVEKVEPVLKKYPRRAGGSERRAQYGCVG